MAPMPWPGRPHVWACSPVWQRCTAPSSHLRGLQVEGQLLGSTLVLLPLGPPAAADLPTRVEPWLIPAPGSLFPVSGLCLFSTALPGALRLTRGFHISSYDVVHFTWLLHFPALMLPATRGAGLKRVCTAQAGRFCSSLAMVVGLCSTLGPSGCLQNRLPAAKSVGRPQVH